MKKELICIECPNGCVLTVEVENGKTVKVQGHKCEKGEKYAVDEIENPLRVLTSTVLASDLEVKMVPVKSSKPISKDILMDVMVQIRKFKINKSVEVGDVIYKNILNTGADIIATRRVN